MTGTQNLRRLGCSTCLMCMIALMRLHDADSKVWLYAAPTGTTSCPILELAGHGNNLAEAAVTGSVSDVRLMVQADRIWADMARAQVRPLVKEDARLQADREMRVLVQQLKVCGTQCRLWIH